MAILITNANANINDTTLSYTLTFTGKTGYKVLAQILVNGTQIGSAETTGSSSVVVTFTAANLYTAAQGSTLTGAVTFRVTDLTIDNIVLGSSSKTGGTITINYRIKDLTLTSPTSGSPMNMDLADPVNLIASWTRVHTAFFARLKFYVYNGSSYTQIFSRYGFTTSTNFDVVAYGYASAIIAAMNGVSPRAVRLQIITQFDDGTSDYQDLSYTASETTGNYNQRTNSNAVTYSFVSKSSINISTFEITSLLSQIPFTITQLTPGTSHVAKLYVGGQLIDTQTLAADVLTGNFSIDSGDRTTMLNTIPTSTPGSAYATVETFIGATSYGTNTSSSVSVTVGSEYQPSVSAVRSELTTLVQTELGVTGTYLKSKSKVRFATTGAASLGSTIKSIVLTFAGQTKSNTTGVSPINLDTDTLSVSGTYTATITITDNRDRTAQWTATGIVILNYTYPTSALDVVRVTSGNVVDLYGNRVRFTFSGAVQSVITSSTERNRLWYQISYKETGATIWTDYTAQQLSALTVNTTYFNSATVFDVTKSYDVRIRIKDDFYLTETDYTISIDIVPKGQIGFVLGDSYASIGKMWERGALDVGGDIYMNDAKVSVDGHIHNYAGSASAGGAATSAIGLGIVGYGNGDAGTMITGYQSDANFQTWTGGWASHLILNHGNGSTYFNNVMTFPFWGPPTYMRKEAGVNKGPWKFWTEESLSITTGTFTPSLIRTTTNPTISYTTTTGIYTKIGNVVFISGTIVGTISTSGSGNWRIAGLPFMSKNATMYRPALEVGLGFSGIDGGYSLGGSDSPYLTASGALYTGSPTGAFNLFFSMTYEI